MTAAAPLVEMKGVCKSFFRRARAERARDILHHFLHPRALETRALQGIDLVVSPGEVVAYAGPNGAGKSTTVKLLSGMLTPDRGTVRVLGLDPARERARYVGHIGVVFGQRTELWWDHPVSASFEWKKVVWDIPQERFQGTLKLLSELLDLEEIRGRLARELSLGQKMRADLAMALLHEPEILFLDEPTIGLDVLAKRNVLQFIQELNRTRGVTVMVTSHDMDDLEQLAGRIVMIHRGQIAFDGAFDRLRQQSGDRRRLLLETPAGLPPVLQGTELLRSENGRHEYQFDANEIRIPALLEQAAAQASILDVETHRAPIDDIIARIYERWRAEGS